jgi:hypothetical protein
MQKHTDTGTLSVLLRPFLILLIAGVMSVLNWHSAESFTCPTATTCTVTSSYKEPLVNANGSTIDDLKQTTLKLTVNGVAQAPIVTPASAATGGGTITKTSTVPAQACRNTVVSGVANAEDTFALVGPDATTTLTITRSAETGCEPGPTTNFTIN